MIENVRAHDLLRINPAGIFTLSADAGFASIPLRDFPFVVVRRAQPKEGRIPVGIRGRERWERRAAWVRPEHIAARVTPESIGLDQLPRCLPVFEALRELKRRWRGTDFVWGPCGSAGFELVTGCRVAHAGSDLDITVRAEGPLSLECLRMLAQVDEELPCTVDMQIETPCGAFSPKEYVRGSARCLLRTNDGPRLVEDPWHPVLAESLG